MEHRAIGQEEETEVIMAGESATEAYKKILTILNMAENAEQAKRTNFEAITESPEKLAEFLDKIIRHCSDYDKDCTECPMKENRNCDYETTLEWLMQESDTE